MTTGIAYSVSLGRLHHLDCSTRVVGWDFRRGWGPAHVQYRCRCDRHGTEWSGGLSECPMGPKAQRVVSEVAT